MLLTFDVSFAQLWHDLTHAGWWLVAIGVLWVVLYTMNALTWWVILRGSGDVGVSFMRLLKFTVSGFAMNYATPIGLLGGEPYKIMELTPYVGVQRATSSVLLFAMTHVFTHFWYWVTAIVLYLLFMPLDTAMAIVLTLSGLFCGAGIYFFVKGYRNGLLRKLVNFVGHIPGCRGWAHRFAERHDEDISNIDSQIAALQGQNRKSFYASLLVEYAGRMMQSLEIYFLLIIFDGGQGGAEMLLYSVLILAFTSLFANLLGFIPMQLGGREGGFALSMAQMGMTNALGLFVSLICRVRELFFTVAGLALMRVGNRPRTDNIQ